MDSTLAPSMYPELIVRTGRQEGASKRLTAAITFIGSAAGCDIRLAVDEVEPIHCAIANGAEGLTLRSWRPEGVSVNGLAVQTRTIHDGDVLTVGPFEFELRIPAHLQKEATDPQTQKSIDHLRELQRQLSEARRSFRSERNEQRQNLDELSTILRTAREDIEKREWETDQLRTRLTQLRKRFLRRWKKHWSGERLRLQRESERLQRERAALDAKTADFQTDCENAGSRLEAARARLNDRWQRLRDAEKTAKEQKAALDRRQRELVEQEHRLGSDSATLQRERLKIEQHTAHLRLEASGLEARIANSRAVLAQTGAPQPPLLPAELSSQSTVSSHEPAIEERLAELQRLIDEVNDQRAALLEQTDHLAEAREAWREEEQRLMREMEELAQRLHDSESTFGEREHDVVVEEEALERERARLEELRDRLESWQGRLRAGEVAVREETGRLEADLYQRTRQIERREVSLADLCRRWSERRRSEVQQLKSLHRRCVQLRMVWQRKRDQCDQRDQEMLQRQRDLAARALIVERAQTELLAQSKDPRITAKRIERLERHLERANRKHHTWLEQRWQSLDAERKGLTELFGRTNERIEATAALEREIADRLARAESREHRLTDGEVALAEQATVFKAQRESYERERAELRDEIDRLAGLLIEARAPASAPLKQAA